MPFAIRHRHDRMPALSPMPSLAIVRELDASVMAQLQDRSLAEITQRFDLGHRAYVARVDGAPAAFGWVATRTANIGELNATFSLPAGGRYLWNFVTLPAFRGRGIYPRLLQAIVHAEAVEAERFWIAYAPENHASGAGIAKAGFEMLAEMSFDTAGRPALFPMRVGGAAEASRVLGLPEAGEPLAPCWRCVRAGRGDMACAAGQCRCDYQQPRSGCAA